MKNEVKKRKRLISNNRVRENYLDAAPVREKFVQFKNLVDEGYNFRVFDSCPDLCISFVAWSSSTDPAIRCNVRYEELAEVLGSTQAYKTYQSLFEKEQRASRKLIKFLTEQVC